MRGRWWKLLGVAGVVGVAATGVVLARDERRRQSYTPEEVRVRLQARYAQATAETVDGQESPGLVPPGSNPPGSDRSGDDRSDDGA